METIEQHRRVRVGFLDDRRQEEDRRRGGDRRGSGERQSPSGAPRPYGFRSFEERRSGQDRRSPVVAPVAVAAGAYDPACDDGPLLELTAEEIAVLFEREAP